MPQNKIQQRAKRDAKIKNDDAEYRLRRFYEILLTADKTRLAGVEKRLERDKAGEFNE